MQLNIYRTESEKTAGFGVRRIVVDFEGAVYRELSDLVRDFFQEHPRFTVQIPESAPYAITGWGSQKCDISWQVLKLGSHLGHLGHLGYLSGKFAREVTSHPLVANADYAVSWGERRVENAQLNFNLGKAECSEEETLIRARRIITRDRFLLYAEKRGHKISDEHPPSSASRSAQSLYSSPSSSYRPRSRHPRS